MAAARLELAVTIQPPHPSFHRSLVGEGADLPGGIGTDFKLDWAHTYGVMRIEVKGGEVFVDGRVVRLVRGNTVCTGPELCHQLLM